MLESGDWVVPRYLDEVRTAKPIFIYWLQAASMKLIGKDGDAGAFAARVPSAIAMTIVLIIIAVVLLRGVDREHAFWAVFIMSTCGLTLWSAKACTTDGVLLIGMTVAQFCLYRIWRGDASWPVMLAFAIAIAEAGLTKGPVVLGVMGTTMLALGLFRLLDRKRPADERFSPTPLPKGLVPKMLVTIVIAAALLAPWLLMIRSRASEFLNTTVSHDVLKRIYQPLEGHKGPPGYHLALVFATYFPWSVLLPMTIIVAWRERRNPQVRFALAAVLGPWVMFEIVRTKLPHYMMPTFPPLAFLTARVIVKCLSGEKDDLVRRPMVIASAVIGLAVIAIGAVTVFAAMKFHESVVPAVVLLVVATGFALAVFVSFSQRKPRQGLLAMGAWA
jgi:4-amino-4-deoxy-L-arabinose transferase-like glycosyltransferase